MRKERQENLYYITTHERLHSAIGYIAPKDKLEGHANIRIFVARDRKLMEDKRKTSREVAKFVLVNTEK